MADSPYYGSPFSGSLAGATLASGTSTIAAHSGNSYVTQWIDEATDRNSYLWNGRQFNDYKIVFDPCLSAGWNPPKAAEPMIRKFASFLDEIRHEIKEWHGSLN